MDETIVTKQNTSTRNEGSFDMDTPRARIVVVCGACGSGKSYACRDLLIKHYSSKEY
jgi:excinuclease UvrABC ATPase subunit